MLDIIIQTVKHEDQKYNTIGNYESGVPGMEKKVELTPGSVIITVSDMGDWRKELAVAIHELIEVSLACWIGGITDEQIVEFDKKYEELAKQGLISDDSEPGDNPDAPYYVYHKIATVIEYGLLVSLGVSEAEYEEAMLKLWRPDGNESKE
jgi:hypothetical protein